MCLFVCGWVGVLVRVCVGVYDRVCECVRVHVRVFVRVCVCVCVSLSLSLSLAACVFVCIEAVSVSVYVLVSHASTDAACCAHLWGTVCVWC